MRHAAREAPQRKASARAPVRASPARVAPGALLGVSPEGLAVLKRGLPQPATTPTALLRLGRTLAMEAAAWPGAARRAPSGRAPSNTRRRAPRTTHTSP